MKLHSKINFSFDQLAVVYSELGGWNGPTSGHFVLLSPSSQSEEVIGQGLRCCLSRKFALWCGAAPMIQCGSVLFLWWALLCLVVGSSGTVTAPEGTRFIVKMSLPPKPATRPQSQTESASQTAPLSLEMAKQILEQQNQQLRNNQLAFRQQQISSENSVTYPNIDIVRHNMARLEAFADILDGPLTEELSTSILDFQWGSRRYATSSSSSIYLSDEMLTLDWEIPSHETPDGVLLIQPHNSRVPPTRSVLCDP